MVEILCYLLAAVFMLVLMAASFCLGILGALSVIRQEAPHAYAEWRRNAAFSRKVEQSEKQFSK